MLMDDRDGVIWLDGEWLPWREAKVHVLTHTLHYGCGVFEGLRAYRPSGAQPSSACATIPTGCSVRRTSWAWTSPSIRTRSTRLIAKR